MTRDGNGFLQFYSGFSLTIRHPNKTASFSVLKHDNLTLSLFRYLLFKVMKSLSFKHQSFSQKQNNLFAKESLVILWFSHLCCTSLQMHVPHISDTTSKGNPRRRYKIYSNEALFQVNNTTNVRTFGTVCERGVSKTYRKRILFLVGQSFISQHQKRGCSIFLIQNTSSLCFSSNKLYRVLEEFYMSD